MKIKTLAAVIVGMLLVLQTRGSKRPRDERGLSQSAETAILLAGAVVVAGIVVTLIAAFGGSRMEK